jgi:hypothetical protein
LDLPGRDATADAAADAASESPLVGDTAADTRRSPPIESAAALPLPLPFPLLLSDCFDFASGSHSSKAVLTLIRVRGERKK